ncbi:MAG TPA: indole-3-glycerol phosphate synthase TrpC [Candidatus Dormibacteraeota bacterium]|nr:indole-3-glycerol phosphate synthase TrpC [Candidatus Dormibacteraeota bacterium]
MKQTDTILDKIVAGKKQYLKGRKLEVTQKKLEAKLGRLTPFDGSGFFETLKAESPRPKLIAEVKQASPSRGVLRESFSPTAINEAYQAAPHVVAISVLTEKDYFLGSEETLSFFARHNTHHKPLLRKDFIFEPYQVMESKLLGARAYLLIASLFDVKELEALVDLGMELGIEPLVEVHDQEELDMAKATKARCIGVNSRDLKTFKVDVKRHELLRELDGSYARVAESGINSPEYLAHLSAFADAALVGSHFMEAGSIEASIEKLVGPLKGRVA